MGYQLRMHSQIRDWLANLRDCEPEMARLVGEALVAMLEAGENLGPPLVVTLESVFRPPADPRETLDYSYQRQLEAMTKVRRAAADVATSRKRVELQAAQLEQAAAKLAGQRDKALEMGRPDLAGEAQNRELAIHEQLSSLREQLAVLTRQEERITVASQRLQARVDAFRTKKETLKASYTADEAARRIREVLAELGEDVTGTDPSAEGSAEADSSPAAAIEYSAAAVELVQEVSDLAGTPRDDSAAADPDGVHIVPGTMELRPGAPDNVRVGLLFVVEPQEVAVLVAWVEDPGGSREEYQKVTRLAQDRLARSEGFVSYDLESLLDEFFPGAETEVEIGAAALIARTRAHTLAQARERLGLTQAQVAARMNVRPGRVAAIELAEPGATEVRTLAAYVGALGGRLEITADIGGERITLR
jgi:hypothetical protein